VIRCMHITVAVHRDQYFSVDILRGTYSAYNRHFGGTVFVVEYCHDRIKNKDSNHSTHVLSPFTHERFNKRINQLLALASNRVHKSHRPVSSPVEARWESVAHAFGIFGE
jgi:hypothetical protein